MDWGPEDWNHVRAFLAAAEAGSFSAAALDLGVSQPTVGRQVAALEEHLGVTLFERVGRTLQPTDSGLELVDHARVMAEGARGLGLAAAGHADAVDGLVRITASQLISAHLLGPAVGRLRREHPGIQLDLVVSNRLADLRRREADVAVRNTAPTDPELVGRRLPDAVARAYATPAYLASVDDLATADWFGFDDTARMVEVLTALGYPVTERSFPVITEDHLVQWSLARAGLGICLVMEQVGEADPDMVRVLPELPGIPIPMWLVTHREVRTSRRLRIVVDVLADVLGSGD